MGNIEEAKTSELLDLIDKEVRKDTPNDTLLCQCENELNTRVPFAYIEHRIEGSDNGEDGLKQEIQNLKEELGELKEQFKAHNHQDGNVVVKL